MNWPDLSMGGYGFYVWGSYLFALIAIVWELVSLSFRKKDVQLGAQASSSAGSNSKYSTPTGQAGTPALPARRGSANETST
jgi:heme exporter protein CcmD